MTTSQSLLRSVALSIVTVSLTCNTAQAQLFRRTGDAPNGANDKAKQSNSRDAKPTADPRQAGTQNGNAPTAKNQPTRGVTSPYSRSNTTGTQAGTNGQAPRPNNPYANGLNNKPATQSQSKVGSGLANQPPAQSRQQPPHNSRTPSSNALAVPRSNLSAQGRSNTPANNPAIPQQPAFFGHQPVAQPTYGQSQSKQSPSPQSQRQQSVGSNNSGLLVAKEETSQQPLSVEGTANLEGSSNATETEIFNRFGVQLRDEDEALWVSNLTASGNGQSAGLNRNDKIVSFGGATLTSKAEFVEIAKLLTVGDQIEIEFERNGKTEKSLILYGQASKDQNNNEGSIQLEDNNNWSTTPTDPRERLERLVAEQQRVIAELQNRIRQLESQSKTAF